MTKITKYTAKITGPSVAFSAPHYVGNTLHAAKCNATRLLGDDFTGNIITIYAYDNVTPAAQKTIGSSNWATSPDEINPFPRPRY